jgi:hypothetical protein
MVLPATQVLTRHPEVLFRRMPEEPRRMNGHDVAALGPSSLRLATSGRSHRVTENACWSGTALCPCGLSWRSWENAMIAPPRRPPQNVPDSLPKRDRGTDVLPDDVRRTERPRNDPPDSPPRKTEDDRAVDVDR